MEAKTLKGVSEATTKIERKARRAARKGKPLAIFIGVSIFIILFSMAITRFNNWSTTHKIRWQIPLRTPVWIEEIKPEKIKVPVIVTPTPSSQSLIFEKAYDKVWLEESGRGNDKTGLNGYCISKGMINEIGYAPSESYCFKDRKEQKETFMLWLSNRLNKIKMPYCNDISDCLLIYSNNSYTLENI